MALNLLHRHGLILTDGKVGTSGGWYDPALVASGGGDEGKTVTGSDCEAELRLESLTRRPKIRCMGNEEQRRSTEVETLENLKSLLAQRLPRNSLNDAIEMLRRTFPVDPAEEQPWHC